jgi:hypothetical protein
MAHAFAKCLGVFGYVAGLLTAVLWGVMWWGAVEREYAATPTGGHDLWFVIQFDLIGALFLGFVVCWLFRKAANWLLGKPSASVSPVEVVMFASSVLMPDKPENSHLSPTAIGTRMLVERVCIAMGRVVRRFRRTAC